MKLNVSVVSVTGVVYAADDVDAVVAPSVEGIMTVLPRHEPIVARLKSGMLEIVRGGERERLTLGDGCIEVAGLDVVVLVDAFTDRAIERRDRAVERRERAMAARARAREAASTAGNEVELQRALRELELSTKRLQQMRRHDPGLMNRPRTSPQRRPDVPGGGMPGGALEDGPARTEGRDT